MSALTYLLMSAVSRRSRNKQRSER
jgi:hypothetical protein